MKLALPSQNTPDAHYDVIVVGAGIAGLVVANRLTRANLKVLLIEQHYLLGGYCSSFKRKGYLFDAASHFYPLLGNPESWTGRILKELGVNSQWVRMDPVDQFHFPDGDAFATPATWEDYISRVKQKFPHEADNLDRYFAEVQQANMLGLLAYFRGKDTPRMDAYRGLSVQDMLDRHFTDRKLKLLLTGDAPHWGAPPARTSFIFDALLRVSYFLGNYYPRGSSQAFSNDLGRAFVEQGGHLMSQTRMTDLEISGNRLKTVHMERGRKRHGYRVKAEGIVFCGDLMSFADLLPDTHAPSTAFREQLSAMRPSLPCFLTHIGARGLSREQLASIHGYHWRDWDPNVGPFAPLKFRLFVPTLYDPNIARADRHVIILQKVFPLDYDSVTDWRAHGKKVETQLINDLTELIPELPKSIEVCMSATARTSARYTLNHHGAMLGWETSPEQLGAGRNSQQGPLENLFFAGHWTRPGGGITPAIISGENAATMLCDYLSGSRGAA